MTWKVAARRQDWSCYCGNRRSRDYLGRCWMPSQACLCVQFHSSWAQVAWLSQILFHRTPQSSSKVLRSLLPRSTDCQASDSRAVGVGLTRGRRARSAWTSRCLRGRVLAEMIQTSSGTIPRSPYNSSDSSGKTEPWAGLDLQAQYPLLEFLSPRAWCQQSTWWQCQWGFLCFPARAQWRSMSNKLLLRRCWWSEAYWDSGTTAPWSCGLSFWLNWSSCKLVMVSTSRLSSHEWSSEGQGLGRAWVVWGAQRSGLLWLRCRSWSKASWFSLVWWSLRGCSA